MVAAEAEALAREAEAKAVVKEFTCSTGIVLNVRTVPPRVRAEVVKDLPRPQVPKVFIESLGREEENPDDPRYAQALIDWQNEIYRKTVHVTFVLGTSVKHVPEGLYRPEDDGWIEEYEAAAEAVGSESKVRRTPEKSRYCDWLLYHALGNEEDHHLLTMILFSLSLVTEAALAQAIESFRSITKRPTDSGSGSEAPGDERDQVPAAAAGGSA